MKKILFFNPYCLWSFHLETDLELINKHLHQGDDIIVLTCNGELLTCDQNPYHFSSSCQQCINRRENGFKILKQNHKIKKRSFIYLTKADKQRIKNYPKYPKSLVELQSLTIDGDVDLGLGVSSSLMFMERDPVPDIKKNREIIAKNIEAALITYFSLKNHIKNIDPDLIYLFNGRFSILRPVLRLAQSLKIPLKVHERGGIKNQYSLTDNTYPHDLNYKKTDILTHWHNSSLSTSVKQSIGSQWFDERVHGIDSAWFSFVKEQRDILPSSFNTDKLNVIIFNSSEDEMAAISNWKNPIYNDQNEGIEKICSDLAQDDNIDIYLRIHPNLKNVNNLQTQVLNQLKMRHDNLHVIEADDDIGSYHLLKNSDLVITFGSTIGIEAAYHKKVSILMGRAIYESLNACFTEITHDSLIKLIKSRSFFLSEKELEKRQSNAIKYGFYMAERGYPFTIFEQVGVRDLLYEGQKIKGGTTFFQMSRRKISFKIQEIFWKIQQIKTNWIRLLERYEK